jgi:hypothetical protein
MRAHGRHCGQEDSQPDDVRYQRAEYQTGTGRKEGPVRGRLSIPAPLSRVSRPARHSAHEMALRDLRARLLLAPAFRMQICLYAEVECSVLVGEVPFERASRQAGESSPSQGRVASIGNLGV